MESEVRSTDRSAAWHCRCGYSNNTCICTKCGAPEPDLVGDPRDSVELSTAGVHLSKGGRDPLAKIYSAKDVEVLIGIALAAANKGRPHEPGAVMPAQADVLGWAVSSFGPIAQNIDERAARIAEEAIEIAQVEGVPLDTIKRIADRVYSRPPGERWQEIGGTMIGILSYAEIVGLSVVECTRREFDRVLSKPREWWQKKHAEKVAAGTADLSPTKAEKYDPAKATPAVDTDTGV